MTTPWNTHGTRISTRILPVGAAVVTVLVLLINSLPTASSCAPNETTTPPRSTQLKRKSPWRLGAATQVLLTHDEPTAALRAAVWAATAVTAAASIAVAAAPDHALRYRRPARAGPRRWEAGWAPSGQAGAAVYGQPEQALEAERSGAKVEGG